MSDFYRPIESPDSKIAWCDAGSNTIGRHFTIFYNLSIDVLQYTYKEVCWWGHMTMIPQIAEILP